MGGLSKQLLNPIPAKNGQHPLVDLTIRPFTDLSTRSQ